MEENMIVEALDKTLWRIERAQKAIKVACAILGISKEQLGDLVYRISDHKGTLRITWNHQWTQRQADAFQIAWELCGESEVQHDWGVF